MPFNYSIALAMVDANVPRITPPVELYRGKFSMEVVNDLMKDLSINGSKVVPGFMKPEGIVIHFPKYNFNLKNTFEKKTQDKTRGQVNGSTSNKFQPIRFIQDFFRRFTKSSK